jgi:hypothetical protein
MEAERARSRVWDWLWVAAWGVASSVWCVTAAGQIGATFDEPVYVARGLEGGRAGSHRELMRMGTMPLPVDLDTLPLYLWERWHGVQLDPEADLAKLLPWARAGTLVFWWVLLIYGWRTGAAIGGRWGGRIAVALLACEPSLLAHAGLATTDIAVTACLLAFVYHFRTGRDGGWLRRVGLPALWFAAAVLAKASGLVFGPVCLVAMELDRVVRAGDPVGEERRSSLLGWALGIVMRLLASWRDCVQIFGIGLVLVFVYCGSDWQPQPAFVEWAQRLPDGPAARALVWTADHLRIFSNAGEGIVRQVRHNVRGHLGAFILGHSQPRAVWYYFPVALTIKMSVPLLLLPAGLLMLRPRALANWACLAAGALLLASLTCRVQIGIRLVLPMVALGVVGLAAAAADTWRSGSGWRRPLLAWLAPLGIGWTALAAVLVWPNGLCYTNDLWGGTERGYLLLSDSNYDWGQGLRELARWQQRQGVRDLDVWYFGTDPTFRSLPMHDLRLHTLNIQGPEDVLSHVNGHYLAVSTTLLYGVRQPTQGHARSAAFLLGQRPVARTTTFLIFDFTREGRAEAHARADAK